MAKRHGGVVTFAVLGIIFGLIGLAYNGFVVIMIAALKSNAANLDAATVESLKAVNGIVLLSLAVSALTGLIAFISGIGLFSLRLWARHWYMASAGISFMNRLAVFPMHFSHPATGANVTVQVANQIGGIVGDLSGIAFNLAILWFFNRAGIKRLFQQALSPSL